MYLEGIMRNFSTFWQERQDDGKGAAAHSVQVSEDEQVKFLIAMCMKRTKYFINFTYIHTHTHNNNNNKYSLPSTKVLPFEHPDLKMYDTAHRKGKKSNAACTSLYPACGFSLHGIALGKYSDPPPNYMM